MALLLHLLVTIIFTGSLTEAKRKLPSYAPGNQFDQYECQTLPCTFGYFNCDCEKSRTQYLMGSNCIPSSWMCDGKADCSDGSDELECTCNDNEIQCSLCEFGGSCSGNVTLDLYQCVNRGKIDDGELDCLSRKDEDDRNIDSEECVQCNGVVDCPHLTPNDEADCGACPEETPNRCECNSGIMSTCQGSGHVCYSNSARCDGIIDCVDASDEANCPCELDEFRCLCNSKIPPTCYGEERCIPSAKYNNGTEDCPDGSDETQFIREVKCDDCNITIHRLSDANRCSEIGFPLCDITTCFSVPALSCVSIDCNNFQVICTSHCPASTDKLCNRGFQCDDGTLAVAAQFCDGTVDCPDSSDEANKQIGFSCIKSNRTCAVPLRNLQDDIAQCPDQSDLCTSSNHSCFQCLDSHQLIPSTQVCDGIVNCFDLSDECLCPESSSNPVCSSLGNSSSEACAQVDESKVDPTASYRTSHTITCQTKYGTISATLCDGRPECRDFSDECACSNPPAFCNDNCSKFYQIGDRYCDGVEDEAWTFINRPECPQGFDEISCPKRFPCQSGSRISIDIAQVCDGIVNCDDGRDESNCIAKPQTSDEGGLFSSRTELLKNTGLKVGFWIMACLAIVGNLAVIYSTVQLLREEESLRSTRFKYGILLNIAMSDLIMGIYLLAIAIQSARFTGNYFENDLSWRSGPGCSTVGSFAFISTEASCLLMLLLTSYLFFLLRKEPAEKRLGKIKKILGFGIAVSWLVGILLAIIPVLGAASVKFVQNIWMENPISQQSVWDVESFETYSCRLAKLSDKTLNPESWKTIGSFLEKFFPEYAPRGVFGYYAETSICMPKIYTGIGGTSWNYFLGILSFNFVVYLVISVFYVFICTMESQKRISLKSQPDEPEKMIIAEREKSLQRRIASVLFTNVLLWIIIAIIAYISAGGSKLSNSTYETTLAVLIPLNSVLNPILNSSLLDIIFDYLRCGKKTQEE